jgi:hypothetical protein
MIVEPTKNQKSRTKNQESRTKNQDKRAKTKAVITFYQVHRSPINTFRF